MKYIKITIYVNNLSELESDYLKSLDFKNDSLHIWELRFTLDDLETITTKSLTFLELFKENNINPYKILIEEKGFEYFETYSLPAAECAESVIRALAS